MASVYDVLLFGLVMLVLLFLTADQCGKCRTKKKTKKAAAKAAQHRKELLEAFASGKMESLRDHPAVRGTALEESYEHMLYVVRRMGCPYGERVDVEYIYGLWEEIKKACQ